MSWGEDAKTPPIDWSMSASLESVVRSGTDVPEVTNLREAVHAWERLDSTHRAAAVLRPERPIMIDGVQHEEFRDGGIADLAKLAG